MATSAIVKLGALREAVVTISTLWDAMEEELLEDEEPAGDRAATG